MSQYHLDKFVDDIKPLKYNELITLLNIMKDVVYIANQVAFDKPKEIKVSKWVTPAELFPDYKNKQQALAYKFILSYVYGYVIDSDSEKYSPRTRYGHDVMDLMSDLKIFDLNEDVCNVLHNYFSEIDRNFDANLAESRIRLRLKQLDKIHEDLTSKSI